MFHHNHPILGIPYHIRDAESAALKRLEASKRHKYWDAGTPADSKNNSHEGAPHHIKKQIYIFSIDSEQPAGPTIAAIKQNINNIDYHAAIMMIGSSKQSDKLGLVQMARGYNEFYHTLLDEISDRSRLRFDTYLLADKHKSDYGKTFATAETGAMNTINTHLISYQDDSKLTLLYSQMHKLASEYPDTNITFDFFEPNFEVYNQLCGFFDNKDGWILKDTEFRNDDLIPKNITLNIICSDSRIERCSYKGTGLIDADHQANINRMIECAGYSETNMPPILESKHAHITNRFGIIDGLLNQDNLNSFKKNRIPYTLKDLTDLQRYAEQQVNRLNHWYIWNGRSKAACISTELKAIAQVNEGISKSQTIINHSEVSPSLVGLFSALAIHRYQFRCSAKKTAKARQNANQFEHIIKGTVTKKTL